MMKVAFHTLGCKVNQYESDAIKEQFVALGYEIVPYSDFADIYIINSCAVTAEAERKSRQFARQAKERNPKARVVVMGCSSSLHPKDWHHITDAVWGTSNREHMAEEIFKDGIFSEDIMKACRYEDLHLEKTPDRIRAYIKIEEGCENYCTYCTIPYVRGKIRSRGIDAIEEEARRLIQDGCREIVITGTEVASYGKDGTHDLCDVVDCIDRIDGEFRIRLSSMSPVFITEKTAQRLSKAKKLCPHFHLSLQSGCDETLSRMGRKYTTSNYLEAVKLLRKYFLSPGITTDIITGFPGETDAEFLKTKEFVKHIGFSRIHVFPYSERPGTVAATMPGSVPVTVRKARAKELIAIGKDMEKNYLASLSGTPATVLIEEEELSGTVGYTQHYIRVQIDGEIGTFRDIIL